MRDTLLALLGGGLGGVLLTLLGTYLLQRRAERREDREARRLLEAELMVMYAAIAHSLKADRWEMLLHLPDTPRWQQYEGQIARGPRKIHRDLSNAYSMYSILGRVAVDLQPLADEAAWSNEPPPPHRVEQLEDVARGTQAAIRKAHRHLAPVTARRALDELDR